MIEVIEEIGGPFGNPDLVYQARVTVNGKHFLVSTSNAFGAGIETLAFKWDEKKGEVADWSQVAGGWHNGMALDGSNTVEVTQALFGVE